MSEPPPPQFSFLPLAEADLPLIARWLDAPHVREWWGDPQAELANITAHLDDPQVDPYRVDLADRPIAYLQCYRVWPNPPAAFRDQPCGACGIDLFIGEPDCLGRGLGRAMIRQFVAWLFAVTDAPCVIIDPDPANRRAIRSYEKAAFRHLRPAVTPCGPAALMVITRP